MKDMVYTIGDRILSVAPCFSRFARVFVAKCDRPGIDDAVVIDVDGDDVVSNCSTMEERLCELVAKCLLLHLEQAKAMLAILEEIAWEGHGTFPFVRRVDETPSRNVRIFVLASLCTDAAR
jgi:hypothetical protein